MAEETGLEVKKPVSSQPAKMGQNTDSMSTAPQNPTPLFTLYYTTPVGFPMHFKFLQLYK